MTATARVPQGLPAARPPGRPQTDGRLHAVDGLRAVAALMVIAFHVAVNTDAHVVYKGAGWLFNAAQGAVPIFFAVSGLLLFRPWAQSVLQDRPAPRTGRYLRTRALRILPAYWLLVICVMVTAGRDQLTDAGSLLRLLTFTHVYHPEGWWESALGPREMGQTWSLAVEAAWYVALPLVAGLLAWYGRRGAGVAGRARRLLAGLAAYGAVSFLFTIFMYVPERRPALGIWPPRFFVWFAAGMAFAVVSVWARAEPRGAAARFARTIAECWGLCWLAALALFVIGASPITGPQDLTTRGDAWTSQFNLLIFGLAAAFFVAPAMLAPAGHAAMGALLGNPVMRFLGKISYGLFLWQMVIILAWYEFTGRLFRGDVLLDPAVVIGLSVLAGTLSYYLVERPTLRLIHPAPRPSAEPAP